jgi:hypothetical protein
MNDIAFILLTQGKQAIIDTEYLTATSQYKWRASRRNWLFYAVRNIKGKKGCFIYLHRFIWETINGSIPHGMVIDHINGDGLDNRLSNLRLVTQHENITNSYARRAGLTSSKYPGVYWHNASKKWQAQIRVSGKPYYLGYYASEIEAHQAYLAAKESMEVNI